jgi:predicted amidohydrolase
MVTEPWGSVVCRADAGETILYADLDLDRTEAIRRQIPILSNRRADLYQISEA